MGRVLKGGAKISEVAAEAGVSRATVSRVMNGQKSVDPKIADRVREAAQKLDYRPSTLARSLSLGRSGTVAVVAPDLRNPMFQEVLRGVMDAANADDYRVLITETADRIEDEYEIAREARLRCDALILVSPRMSQPDLEKLLSHVSPVVLINRTSQDHEVPALCIDHRTGVERLLDHLVALGHTDLAYSGGPPGSISDMPRRAALRATSDRHPNVSIREIPGGATVDSGYAAADAVLASHATAVLAFNDLAAFGLLARINETGLTAPDGISVTGFDDNYLARYATPSLTTVNVPHGELGRQAWHRLSALIGHNHGDGAEPHHAGMLTTFTPELTVRASTGPVPASHRLEKPSSDLSGLAKIPEARAVWTPYGDGWKLEAAGRPLTYSSSGRRMPAVHSPRPHLHPVHSLRGCTITERSPKDHRHHYGASMAIADVDGTTYWGGRTYVPGEGATLLANHGQQSVESASLADEGSTLMERILWKDEHETIQLQEDRTLTGVLLAETEAWVLGWESVLHTAGDDEVVLSSSAVKGRTGAGYGGFFWRLPNGRQTRVMRAGGPATEVHGSSAEWVAVSTHHADEQWTTLLLAQQGEPDPWFMRASDYVGLGPSVAWSEPCRIRPGRPLVVGLTAVVADRCIDAGEAEELLALARSRLGTI